MAKPRFRKRYTDAQRAKILTAAQRDYLTAAQVKKRFGVIPVTYYSWRKKSGVAAGRKRGVIGLAGDGRNLSTQVRGEVRTRLRQILPVFVRGEVNSYLNSLFAAGPGRRRQRV